MSTTALQAKADQFRVALSEIESNRRLWYDEIKPLLVTVLTRITQETALVAEVQHLDDTLNNEGVNLAFSTAPSGMRSNPESFLNQITEGGQTHRMYVKQGGYIVFAQSYNGLIVVLIGYPHIEEKVTQAPSKLLGKFNPRDITESFIEGKVGEFFDEMIRWERESSDTTRLGFLLSGQQLKKPV